MGSEGTNTAGLAGLIARRTDVLLCAVVATLSTVVCNWSPVRQVEKSVCDQRARLVALSRAPSPEIVIVGIDDESLQLLEPQVGRWPWPRAVIGSLINYCSSAEIIGLDILFAEQDHVFQGSDDHLAAEVSFHGSVVGATYISDQNDVGLLPDAVESSSLPGAELHQWDLTSYPNGVPPYPALLSACSGLGVVTNITDSDGVMRHYALVAKCQGKVYPSLALAMAMRYKGVGVGSFAVGPGNACRLEEQTFPTDTRGALLLDFPSRRHRVISAADLLLSQKARLEGEEPEIWPEDLAGKIVILGSTATGVHADRIATPVEGSLPGVHVHAVALDNLLNNRAFQPVRAWVAFLLTILLALPISASPLRRPLGLLGSHVALGIAYICATVFVAIGLRWILPLTSPIAAVLSCGLALGIRYWRRDQAERRRLEELEAAKQRFTDMLVHDLKNRVAPISMALAVVDRQLSPDNQAGKCVVSMAQVSAERLLTEIKSLLDIRRMSEGQLGLQPQMTSLADFLTKDLEAVQSAALQLGFKIRIEHGTPHLSAPIDRGIISRVLGNLVWNAFEHGTPDSELEVGYERTGDDAIIWVANHGPVVPEDQREAMFEAYVSVGTGNAGKRISGTGLGLTFCKLATEAHGGTIRLMSPWPSYADGVKVCVVLPL
ncbi:MAG: CHASE2 domain-containing protein [Lentisphaerae bacterium]|nr:CHASE2 domain-containing protein [Lentisphaerota bacterium]